MVVVRIGGPCENGVEENQCEKGVEDNQHVKEVGDNQYVKEVGDSQHENGVDVDLGRVYTHEVGNHIVGNQPLVGNWGGMGDMEQGLEVIEIQLVGWKQPEQADLMR